MTPLVGIPIKPFGVAKVRLSGVLGAPDRERLGKAVAANTAATVAASGQEPVIVTGSDDVNAWAGRHGWRTLAETPGGLDGAAAAVVAAAGDRPWVIIHADLPVIDTADLEAVWRTLAANSVIAPSRDGGTSVLAGLGPFPFSYGRSSFHRHLASLNRHQEQAPVVVARPGLAFDLDTPADLRRVLSMPAGAWLSELPGLPVP